LVEFDLSAIIGWSINVDSATLEVYEKTVGDTGVSYGVYRIQESWEEDTVIWANRPSWGASAFDVVTSDSSPGWWSFDVTALVQHWIDETYPNYGFAITHPGGGCSPSLVNSSEYGITDPDQVPTLTIEYTVTDIEPTSWGSIKAEAE
jgi:hypothetical protein